MVQFSRASKCALPLDRAPDRQSRQALCSRAPHPTCRRASHGRHLAQSPPRPRRDQSRPLPGAGHDHCSEHPTDAAGGRQPEKAQDFAPFAHTGRREAVVGLLDDIATRFPRPSCKCPIFRYVSVGVYCQSQTRAGLPEYVQILKMSLAHSCVRYPAVVGFVQQRRGGAAATGAPAPQQGGPDTSQGRREGGPRWPRHSETISESCGRS